MAVKKKEEQLDDVLSRAVGKGTSAGENLGQYTNANGQVTTVRPEFAGQTVQMGNKYITYDDRGSPTKAMSVDWAKNVLGNDYTMQNMGMDQSKIANAGDIYRAIYNQGMGNPVYATGDLTNAYGKRNIQFDGNKNASDYESLIQLAASKGNNVLAGYYEDSRNALLSSRGLGGQTSNYNGGWNYVDNGGGVGNIYAGAMADPTQQNLALGGGWQIGEGLGNAQDEYRYVNNDFPTMQELEAYAKLKDYDTEDENVTIPVGDLVREMMQGGYLSAGTQQSANALNAAMPYIMQNMGIEGDMGTGALNTTIAQMKNNMSIDDATMQMLQEAATAKTPVASGGYGGAGYGGGNYSGMANQLMNMNYSDWTKGNEYASLADRYSEQGNQAMQNVLGQVSSRTGGMASSYATTAAQQQYNEYIAALEEVARQMYESDRDNLRENVDLARSMEQEQYERQIADRNWQYQMQQDQLAANRQTASDMQSRIDAYLAAGGKVANLDPSMIAQSGYTTAELTAMESYYTAKNAPRRRTGDGDGGDEVGDGIVDETYESGSSAPRASVTNFSYNPMQGTMMWNGKTYTSVEQLQNDVNNAGLTDEEEYLLTMQLRFNGFNVGK